MPAQAGPLQFRLRSLLLVMTWAAVCLGLARAVPMLGLAAMLVSLPALARTWNHVATLEAAGRPATTAEVVRTFLGSIAILLAICVVWLVLVAGAALAATLFVILAGTWLCRVGSLPRRRLQGYARRLPRHIVRTVRRNVAFAGRLVRRETVEIKRLLLAAATMLALSTYVLVATGLFSLILTVVAIAFLSERVARIHGHCRGLERYVVSGADRVRAWSPRRNSLPAP